MKNMTLLRLKHTARLEKLIEEGASYEKILKASKKLDKYITYEIQKQSEEKLNIKKN